MTNIESFLNLFTHWLGYGVLNWPWWKIVALTLVMTHITIAAVTIFLHRCQAHRSLELHAIPSHFFRLWLWLTTGMVTKEWAAIHRKHHAKCETVEDPHSPQVKGIKTVFWRGADLYREEAKNLETIEKFGHGTPNDWIENNLYSRFQWQGVGLMLIIDVILFGAIGGAVWAVQMLWIPITAAGIINGIGHYWGYRNFDCEDASTNISPWGIIIGGEELHNNHHTFPTSAKLSNKWYEFDIGWMYIRMMEIVGWATVKKVPPKPKFIDASIANEVTLLSVIANRYDVMARYSKTLQEAFNQELAHVKSLAVEFAGSRQWLYKDEAKLTSQEKERLESLMAENASLKTLIEMRRELAEIWARSTATREQLIAQLQEWCRKAEESGLKGLQEFSLRLRRYA